MTTRVPRSPPAGDDTSAAAAVCLEGPDDCNDTLYPGDEPLSDVALGGDSVGMPAGSGLNVSEALETDATGPISVHGFHADGGSGPMLCEAPAESFPPQCGGAPIPLADLSAVDPDSIQINQDTSWSDDEVLLLGEITDGVRVPTEMPL